MNKEKILQSFKDHLIATEKIGEFQVYKGEYRPKDNAKNAAIFFLDIDEDYQLDNFKNRQENLLANLYYSNDNYLQWNIYYFIARENVDSTTKSLIENDFEYARKYFIDDNSIDDYFSIDKIKDGFEFSIVDQWKQKLKASYLAEMLGDISATTLVDNFPNLNNNEEIEHTIVSNDEELHIKEVKSIEYTSEFRPFPKEANFNFGKINLINGSNGVGKTSILESIEQLICGGTRRNPKSEVANNSIKGLINDTSFTYTQKPTRFYQSRDQAWYSSPKAKNIKLYHAFNRFNFLNTDAGVEFIKSESDEELIESLKRLVLGDEYSELKKKSERVRNALKPKLKAIKSEIEKNETSITASQDKIAEYQLENIEMIKVESLFQILSTYGIKTKSNIQNEFDKISPTIDRVIQLLKDLADPTFSYSTFSDITKSQNEFQEIEKVNMDISELKADLLKEENLIKIQLEDIDDTIKLIDSTEIYFTNPFLFDINNIKDNYNKAMSLKDSLNIASSIISDFETNHPNLIFSKLKLSNSAIEDELNELQIGKSNLERRIKKITNKLTQANTIITQIQGLGTQLLSIDGLENNCPLCNYNHGKEVLKSLIEKSAKIESIDENLNDLIKSLSTYTSKIEKLKSEISSIEELSVICKKLSILRSNIGENIAALRKIISDNSNIESKLSEYTLQLKLIDDNKLSIEQFKNLQIQLGEKLNVMKFTKTSNKLFQNAKTVQKNKKFELENALSTLQKEGVVQIEAEINKAKKIAIELNSIEEIEDFVKSKKQQIDSLKPILMDVTSQVSFSADTSILKTIKDLEFVALSFDRLKEKSIAESLIEKESKDIETLKVNTAKLEDEALKYEKAIITLDFILNGSEESELNSFLSSHLKSILDIFKSIHHPKEFKLIQLEDGKIFLIDINDQKRSLSQISTGQRSAFVISVFLSLNMRLQKGPNIVLFDDPISFIDDINALSFIDFLRMFSHKYNRQIFFSTANRKLAKLFKYKFDYLKDDFKIINLTR